MVKAYSLAIDKGKEGELYLIGSDMIYTIKEVLENLIKLSSKKDKGEYISKEYHSTKFYRSFALPENVVADEIHAKVENGIVILFLPKVTPTKGKNLSKTIEIA